MKLRNISKQKFQHSFNGELIEVAPQEVKDVPEEVAKLWLSTKAFETIGDEKIEKENAELKAKVAELEAKANAQAEIKAEKKNEGHGFPVNEVPDEDTEFRDVEEDKPSKTKKKK